MLCLEVCVCANMCETVCIVTQLDQHNQRKTGDTGKTYSEAYRGSSNIFTDHKQLCNVSMS